MILVRWVKLLNLYSQPEAWACFHDLLVNQLSLLHVTSGQVYVVRTCLLGNNFLCVSCFFTSYEQKHSTLFLWTIFSRMAVQ